MGFVLIWRTRPGFCWTGCNASVSGYSIAGLTQSRVYRCGTLKRLFVRLFQHNSRFWISHGHLALGAGLRNASSSGYLSAVYDVTILVADCLCNERTSVSPHHSYALSPSPSRFFFPISWPLYSSTYIPSLKLSSSLQAPSGGRRRSGLSLVLIGMMDGAGRQHVSPITSEWMQLLLISFLYQFRTEKTLRLSPEATWEVRLLFCYMPDSDFLPFPTHFASASGYTQLLWTWTLFLESNQRTALFGTLLVFQSALIVSESTMSSSSSTLTFCLIASPCVVHLASSLYILKALNISFPKSLGATREVCPLSCYMLDCNLLPALVGFASALGYTWLL